MALAAQSWKLALGCVSGNGSTCVAVARLEEGNETTLDDESDEVEASDDEEGPHWPSSESGTRPANRWRGDSWRCSRGSGVHAASTVLRTITAPPTASSGAMSDISSVRLRERGSCGQGGAIFNTGTIII